MRIVFAPDSFKGTLSAQRICELLDVSAKKIFPDCQTVGIPISDGGEGAVDAIIPSVNGEYITIIARNPLGNPVKAKYGVFQNDCAIIEMAAASGLPLISPNHRDIMHSSTYGTGQLIADALDRGYTKLHIAIGGSATNDGGIGCAAALGARFWDDSGKELAPIPENLEKIYDIDITCLHPLIKNASFTVMCDVTNPLIGPTGATHVFGSQKGATEENLVSLERGMTHYAKVIKDKLGIDISMMPGAGAAGGLGAGLMVFTHAILQSGIETILDILQFPQIIKDADLVVTGEGMMDFQSIYGKVPSGVGRACKAHGIPCIAIVGGMGKAATNLYDYGIDSIMTTINGAMPIQEALSNAEELFLNAAERMFRLVKIGMKV